MTRNKILISCLVLNGSRSGYRRIIRNLLLSIASRSCDAFDHSDFIFLFQRSGWNSLGFSEEDYKAKANLKIVIYGDFRSKWSRGILEQILVPINALKNSVDSIFMPATFGLLLPIKPTITFVHTNTSFTVEKRLRGRSRLQQTIHNILLRVTAYTSTRLLFTTEQTHKEFEAYCKAKFPKLILGNGLVSDNQTNEISHYDVRLTKYRYILSVSQFYRLKNFDSLIKSFLEIKSSSPELKDKLVIVGTIQEVDYYQELKSLASKCDDIIFLHDIEDGFLTALFANCRAYCFYSYFEGYSLTPAEAMLFERPVAISRIPTHLEVYEDDPIYAEPNDLDSIKKSLKEVMEFPIGQRKRYSRSIIDKFSFDSFAHRLIDWLRV